MKFVEPDSESLTDNSLTEHDQKTLASAQSTEETWNTDQYNEESFISIARFTSAAEAGFFAHELTHHKEILAHITPDEHFDAINGYWSTWFVLSVPEVQEESAKTVLQQLIQETDSEEFESIHSNRSTNQSPETTSDSQSSDEADLPELFTQVSGINWIPILLTLTAGSAAFWVARKAFDRPVDNQRVSPMTGQQSDELWDILDDDTSPWIQRLQNDRGTRQLHVDPDHRRITIYEDRDGDGLFERKLP